jgi:hypothetical protein
MCVSIYLIKVCNTWEDQETDRHGYWDKIPRIEEIEEGRGRRRGGRGRMRKDDVWVKPSHSSIRQWESMRERGEERGREIKWGKEKERERELKPQTLWTIQLTLIESLSNAECFVYRSASTTVHQSHLLQGITHTHSRCIERQSGKSMRENSLKLLVSI